MKISICNIPQSGIKVSHEYDPKDLDIGSSEIVFKKPIFVDARCCRAGDAVTVELVLKTSYEIKCARCLNIAEKELNKQLLLSYIVKPHDSFVDITQDIREEIILNYPLVSLCKEECKGLCVNCGKDLNEGSCDCSVTKI